MSLKGTKRITENRVVRWARDNPKISGPAGVMLISLMIYLGVAIIQGGVTYSEYCGGEELCWIEIDKLCFINTTFVYPGNYSQLLNTNDTIENLRLYRKWGLGWREYPLNQTCTGTWCGAPYGEGGAAYSVAFREDKCYDFRITANKDLYSDVAWKINPEGVWKGINELRDCDMQTYIVRTTYEDTITKYRNESRYVWENCTYTQYVNKTNRNNYTVSDCTLANYTVLEPYTQTIKRTNITRMNECVQQGNVYYGNENVTIPGHYCTVKNKNTVICDSIYDGNGDGKCQPGGGETCTIMKYVPGAKITGRYNSEIPEENIARNFTGRSYRR